MSSAENDDMSGVDVEVGATVSHNPTWVSHNPTCAASPATLLTSSPTDRAGKSTRLEKAERCDTHTGESTTAVPEKPPTEQAEQKAVNWWVTARSTVRIASMMFRSRRTRCLGVALIVAMVFLLLLETLITAWISQLFSDATNAMVSKDKPNFDHVLSMIAIAAAAHLPVVCILEAVQGTFAIEWRRCVTKKLLAAYISGKQAYYRMKALEHVIDNPDQRIGQDVAEFTFNIMRVLVTIIGSTFKVFIVSALLIAISAPLFFYVVVGALVFTVLFLKVFGGQLMRLTRLVLGQEASFRFALIRVREHAESIAFFQGAPFELIRCTQLVEKALRTYYKRLSVWVVFTGGQKAVITFAGFLPIVILGPSVFQGDVTIGTITQTNMLFTVILASLTSLITDLQTIASMCAQAVRIEQLRTMLEVMEGDDDAACVDGAAAPKSRIVLQESLVAEKGAVGPLLEVERLTLLPPRSSTPLVSDLSLRLRRGESLLLCGESGIGKSSLLRAVGGLWAEGAGSITRCPSARSFFLPQRPYLCLGTLRENIQYPTPPLAQPAEDVEGTAAIMEALCKVGLAYLAERHGLDEEVDFDSVLSGGEKQRLGFARLLLRPSVDFAILDEPTSALDPQNEQLAYELLVSKVSTFVSVGHRATLEKFHTHKMLLERRPCGECSGTVQPLEAA